MTEPGGGGTGVPDASAPPGAEVDVTEAGPAAGNGPAPEDAFQTLASEVRVTVLVELLSAEQAGEDPVAFSELQGAAGSDSSAGFAYHLRQLSGHFVRRTEEGYVLTPPGRRAAEAVVSGTFTDAGRDGRAS
ncbi:MAG: hypothetical protein ABEH66_06950 [Halobacteriales archaeon]